MKPPNGHPIPMPPGAVAASMQIASPISDIQLVASLVPQLLRLQRERGDDECNDVDAVDHAIDIVSLTIARMRRTNLLARAGELDDSLEMERRARDAQP